MDWVPLAIAALLVGPLWATGELGLHAFEAPRSHLVWDEAMGQEPSPLDEPGGVPMLAAQLAAGALLVLAVVLWPRRSPS